MSFDLREHKGIFPNLVELARMEGKDLLFYDLETTGLLPKKGSNMKSGIVEIGVGMVTANGEVLMGGSLVNPECRINPEASRVHGITYHQVRNMPTFDEFREDFASWFQSHVVLGFNNEMFDNKYILYCQERYLSQADDKERFLKQPGVVIDVRKYHMHVNNERGGKLVELARSYGAEIGKAHRAEGDVLTTMSLFDKMITKHGMSKINNIRKSIDGKSLSVGIFDCPIERKIRQHVESTGRISDFHIQAIALELGRKETAIQMKVGELFSRGVIDESAIVNEQVQRVIAEHLPDVMDQLPDARLKPIKDGLLRASGQDFEYNQIRIAVRRFKDSSMPDEPVEKSPVSSVPSAGMTRRSFF